MELEYGSTCELLGTLTLDEMSSENELRHATQQQLKFPQKSDGKHEFSHSGQKNQKVYHAILLLLC